MYKKARCAARAELFFWLIYRPVDFFALLVDVAVQHYMILFFCLLLALAKSIYYYYTGSMTMFSSVFSRLSAFCSSGVKLLFGNEADCKIEVTLLLMLSLVDSDSSCWRERTSSTLDTIASVAICLGVQIGYFLRIGFPNDYFVVKASFLIKQFIVQGNSVYNRPVPEVLSSVVCLKDLF